MKENWKTFDFTSKKGITIKVEWWPKDFAAIFESEGIRLSTGLHIMYMCPKVYTEEMLRADYCESSCRKLKTAFDLLKANPDFIENYKERLQSVFAEKNKDFEALQEERRTKRQQLKAGELSQKEWTAFCKQYRAASIDDSLEKSSFTREYVSGLAGGDITVQNILIDYLAYK